MTVTFLNVKRPLENDTIHPFDEEALILIFQHGNGNTRRIITLYSNALDASLDLQKRLINIDFIQSMLGRP